MKSGLYALSGGIFASALFLGAAANAETLTVEGHKPATSDAGIELEYIGIDRIDGRQGSKLGFAIKRALERVELEGSPWFQLPASRDVDVDAVIQGAADDQSSITELDDKKVRSCVKKDDDKKCIQYETNYYECSRYEVSLYPDLELVSREGEVLYSLRDELSRSEEHCADESSRPSRRDMLDGLVGSVSRQLRRALAPIASRSNYRVLERRKGLDKAGRKTFKEALKLTKSDQDASCAAFRSLEAANPAQTSVLFNIALCAERDGALDVALEYYDRALALEPDKLMTQQAIDRVNEWALANRQLEERAMFLEARYSSNSAADEAFAE